MAQHPDLPALRPGLSGLWDGLIGPGATPAENILVLLGALLGGSLAVLLLAYHNAPAPLLVVGGFLGLDLIGGAVANATDTTKRWYHRPGVGVVQHLTFILPHLAHILAVAWLFRGGDGWFFALFSLTLLSAAGTVLAVPTYLKRPVAAGLYLGAVALGLYAVTPTTGLEWFVPVLFFKLLVGHLVPEKPHSTPELVGRGNNSSDTVKERRT